MPRIVRLASEERAAIAIYQLGEDSPRIAATAWVADSARVIGRVQLDAGASIWWGAVLRGDNDWITVGEHSNVQDGSVLHTDHGFPLTLGAGVTVGHQVVLHGCTVGDGALIGIRSVVLNGARIGRDCLVGAGALVTEGKEFPDGWLILGAPARAVRPVTPQQIERMRYGARHYLENAGRYRHGLKRIA